MAADWAEDASCIEGEDALLAVLIPSLSRLEAIDVEMPIFHDRLKHLLDRVAFSDSPLPSLTALHNLQSCCVGYGAGAVDGALLPSLLALPSIQSIYMHSVASQQQYWSPYSPSNGLDFPTWRKKSNCTHLELRHCRVGARQLSQLLAIPKSLRSLVYIEARDRGVIQNTNFSDLGRAILQQKDSLEEAWVDISHDYIAPRSWVLTATDDVGPIYSLRACTKLRKLRIAAAFVFGIFETSDEKSRLHRIINLVPAGIEELSLTHCETQMGEVCDAVEALVYDTKHHQCFESLHMITIELSTPSMSSYKEQLDIIVDFAQLLGIKMKLRNNHSDRLFRDYEGRSESRWGFDSEIDWAPCSNKRNRKPIYEEIEMGWTGSSSDNLRPPSI
ncbi:hypothetical protein K431DRAFT_308133 [Polychaeton citri CBS 116435]|uniref:Uncharacterized protein n=1 Tax=Polychaeton citri CBS 116435 TaxID=1314669 RepID=A0A9P4UK74_9PEZI|nr:hypothetical protein K431DRAFT_308133 [Polychaeton citri CBS 116435]